MKIVNKCMSTQYILMIGIFILLSCNCISENSIFKRDFIKFENIDRIDLDANVDADADNEIDLQESKSDNEVKKVNNFKSFRFKEKNDDENNDNSKKSIAAAKDKLKKFVDNVQSKMISQRTYQSSPPEGIIDQFNKEKFVKPGNDLFLGFLKYISSSATKVQQRYAKEKKDFANLK